MAELCLQRGDIQQARAILERRIAQGASDFKTRNLHAISLGHLRKYTHAITIFARLREETQIESEYARASFNLGLVQLYHDLNAVGDRSVARTIFPMAERTILPVQLQDPFMATITMWDSMLRSSELFLDIVHTYIAFPFYQLGYFDHTLGHLANGLNQNESFYITHYLIGRTFLDLFLLASEGNDFALPKDTAVFYEIDESEIRKKADDDRVIIHRESLLDLALHSLLDARALSPLTAAIYLALCETYLYGQMVEEAYEALSQAEALAPKALATLEMGLRFNQFVRNSDGTVQRLMERVRLARRREDKELYNILPSYYLM